MNVKKNYLNITTKKKLKLPIESLKKYSNKNFANFRVVL